MGGPSNPLLEDAALSTQIVAGKGDGGAAFALNRLAQQSDGRDRVLLAGFREIAKLCQILNVNQHIKMRAQEIFKQATEEPSTKVRGSGNNAVYAAVVYIACRQENSPRSFKELLAAIPGTGVKEVGKYYKKILKGLNLGADVGVANVVDYLVWGDCCILVVVAMVVGFAGILCDWNVIGIPPCCLIVYDHGYHTMYCCNHPHSGGMGLRWGCQHGSST